MLTQFVFNHKYCGNFLIQTQTHFVYIMEWVVNLNVFFQSNYENIQNIKTFTVKFQNNYLCIWIDKRGENTKFPNFAVMYFRAEIRWNLHRVLQNLHQVSHMKSAFGKQFEWDCIKNVFICSIALHKMRIERISALFLSPPRICWREWKPFW